MCMFCAAMPLVVGATAVARDEQRKKLAHVESRRSNEPRRRTQSLSPKRITQLGAAALIGLLVASGFYHTHFPA
jgi:hypothetical protein